MRSRATARDANPRGSLGILVEASIVGRVLGLRLLKLDALVVVVPADVAPPSSAARARARPSSDRSPAPSVAGRGRLAEAVRTIDEGAAILAEARRNGARISRNAHG